MIVQTLMRLMIGITLLAGVTTANAQRFQPNRMPYSIEGYWTTVDDKTDRVRSIVKIWERNGVVYGRIQKIFKQAGDTGICSNCPGRFRNKPILGLTIVWGLERTEPRVWSGGEILDPKSGKIYRVKMTLSPDGRRLEVRGYLGFTLFGRTQYWYRRR